MDPANKAYKKLTNANGLVRCFAVISLILSVLGVLLEPVGKLVYNMIFSKKIDYLFVDGFKNYIKFSQFFYVLLVMSIALMVAGFSSKTKKNIGQGFSSLFVLVPTVMAVSPFIDMLDYLDSRSFKYYMEGADNLKFRGLIYLVYYLLIICTAVLFLISGIALLAKASGERATEVIAVQRKQKKAPQQGFNPQNQYNPNGGFNNQNQFNPNAQFPQQGFNNPNNAGFAAAPFAPQADSNTFRPDNNTFAPKPDSSTFAPKPDSNTFAPIKEEQVFKPETDTVSQTTEIKEEKADANTFAPISDNAVMASAPIEQPVKTEPEITAPEQPANNAADVLQKVCPECGTVLAATAKFCKNCGKPV